MAAAKKPGTVVSTQQLEDMRDELDRTLNMIDALCQQRPFLIMFRAYLEGVVGSREDMPTERPPREE
jgi:hypothetical protein